MSQTEYARYWSTIVGAILCVKAPNAYEPFRAFVERLPRVTK